MRISEGRKNIGKAAAVAVVAVGVVACGGSPGSGGDTTCGEFSSMSKDDQSQVIRDFLAEKGDSNPNGLTVGATRLSAVAFCKTLGTESSLIREIDGS